MRLVVTHTPGRVVVSAEDEARPASERFAAYLEGWNVDQSECLAYVERLEVVLGREIDEREANRLLHPIFHTLRIADEARRVLAGGAAFVPLSDGGGDVYLEVHDLPGDAELARGLYEVDWAATSAEGRAKWKDGR